MLPRLFPIALLAAATVASSHAGAQHHTIDHGQYQERGVGASPYAGLETRTIKALSEQQIADLRAGRGMGLALAAELNGYPGPLHVIELRERIGLTPNQQTQMVTLYSAMKAETGTLGERLIQQEADLDSLFALRTVTPVSLSAATSGIGATQAALREAHLRYHLSTVEVLTPEQVARYHQLRGYQGGPQDQHPHDAQHHCPK